MSDLQWLKEEAQEIKRLSENLSLMVQQHRERLMYNITNINTPDEERRELLNLSKLTERNE